MDNLDMKLKELDDFVVVGERGDYQLSDKGVSDIKQLFKEDGYIKIPTGRNVTVTTGDNESGKLMTEQEWREKYDRDHIGPTAVTEG